MRGRAFGLSLHSPRVAEQNPVQELALQPTAGTWPKSDWVYAHGAMMFSNALLGTAWGVLLAQMAWGCGSTDASEPASQVAFLVVEGGFQCPDKLPEQFDLERARMCLPRGRTPRDLPPEVCEEIGGCGVKPSPEPQNDPDQPEGLMAATPTPALTGVGDGSLCGQRVDASSVPVAISIQHESLANLMEATVTVADTGYSCVDQMPMAGSLVDDLVEAELLLPEAAGLSTTGLCAAPAKLELRLGLGQVPLFDPFAGIIDYSVLQGDGCSGTLEYSREGGLHLLAQ